MLGVVGYGGGLWHTWFDRDLTLTGRALVRRGARLAHELLTVDRAVCRIPTLAIHLSQGDERTTFKPNLQSHLPPMLATGLTDALAGDGAAARHDALVVGLAAEALGCAEADIVELELQLADAQPSARGRRVERRRGRRPPPRRDVRAVAAARRPLPPRRDVYATCGDGLCDTRRSVRRATVCATRDGLCDARRSVRHATVCATRDGLCDARRSV